jgi:hypothetical protein
MEMPIWAMITLFLAVTVGSMILLFGADLLGLAKTDLESQFDGEEGSRIFWQVSMTDSQIAGLVEECYKASFGQANVKGVCFAVTLDNEADIKSASIAPLVKLDQNKFKINDGKTTSFSIVWNFINSKVEVKT